MAKRLSPKQEKILKFIRQFIDEYHFPPTVRDMQTGCEISSTSVVDYNLRILQREGYLKRLPDVSRGIELVNGQRYAARADFIQVPVVGNIAAGSPLPVPPSDSWRPDEMETVELPSYLTKGKQNVYGLRVKGDSMIDALVTDGDLVLMEPVSRPSNGDMVAAWLTDDQEVTLKRFYLEGDTVRLQPANSTMQPILVPADKVAVRGRVVGVVRRV